jgi:preprotein translocase subunit SecB
MQKIFMHALKLREVTIEKIDFRRTGSFDPDNPPKPNVNIKLKGKTIDRTKVYSYVNIAVTFQEEGKARPFFLNLILRGLFASEKPLNRSHLKRFAETNTLIVLIPWARELVATLTRQMGLPPLMLPLINVEQTMKAASEEKTQ